MSTPSPDQAATAVRVDSDARQGVRSNARKEQFAPGTIIADRYRIAGILGSGGMGEVYRAEDIKLDQTVALKFLPAKLAHDATLLDRLHDEVRLGRQVTHPNVCRIYDIGEWNDAHFVAMEYVDGEDLSRLLHRIGRLPHDKAVDITRGIAAGLSAAHAKGILHRDLKPANVMIDSQGDARITDFGLALTDGAEQEDVAGTPAYMAPELLEGGAATVQSDLYALGLVMYEVFTGKRLYSGRSLQELRREKSSEITTPSNVIRDIEPAVERLMLRCLAHDPTQRPRSAREVIAALPGGDPLAAALAAGETPSPRLVAAAGAEGSLSRRAAWTLLAAIAVLFVALFAIRRTTALSKYVSLDRSPEVLRQGAREILHELGIPVRGTPIAHFYPRREYFAWLRKSPERSGWEALRNGPPMLVYHLRYGVWPEQARAISKMTTAPGNTSISVDPHGRLEFFLAVPEAPVKPRPLDWRPLLDATGVDVSSLRAVPPRHAPPAPFDARAAWSGRYAGDTTPIRIEAAAWQGTPVFLRVTGDWDEAADPLAGVAFESSGADLFIAVVSLFIVVSSILLAWRNLRLRRGDRQGALRVAIAYLAIDAVARLLLADYPGRFTDLLGGIWRTVMPAAAGAVLLYALYIAFEPFARKKWPEQLISWTRLLAGRVRDPMVGRDVLIGVVGGLLHGVLSHGGRLLASWLSRGEVVPLLSGGWYLSGFRYMLGATLSILLLRVVNACAAIMILVLLTIVLRKRALAAAGFFLLLLTYFMLQVAGRQPELIPVYIAVTALLAFIAVRYGVVAYAATQTTFFVLMSASAEASPWMAGLSMVPVVAVVALALWAFRVSLGGQSLLPEDVLGD